MGKRYFIDDKKVLIYGAGDMARRITKTFASEGKEIEAYIDKRAGAYNQYQGKEVYSVEKLLSLDNKDDYVVIIAIKNAFGHNDIAVELKRKGFFNLIFKPMYVLKGGNDQKELSTIMRIHGDITDGYQYNREEITSVENVNLSRIPSHAIIKEEEEMVTCFIPSEMIFYKNAESSSDKLGAHMVSNRPAVRMYENFEQNCLDNNCEGLNDYLQEAREASLKGGMPVDIAWENNFIEGKVSVYRNMKKQLNMTPDFFVNPAALASFFKPSFMQIAGTGKNRISFLMAQGFEQIPLTLPYQDYQEYMHTEVAEEVDNLLGEQALLVPIPHPYFYEKQTQKDGYIKLWIVPLARALYDLVTTSEKKTIEWKVYDCLQDWGTTSRILSTMGFQVMRETLDDVTEALDRLFYFEEEHFETWNLDTDFDVLIMSSERMPEDIVLEKGKKVIFVQAMDTWKWEDVSRLLPPDFKYCKTLFSTVWQGRKVAGFQFIKEN